MLYGERLCEDLTTDAGRKAALIDFLNNWIGNGRGKFTRRFADVTSNEPPSADTLSQSIQESMRLYGFAGTFSLHSKIDDNDTVITIEFDTPTADRINNLQREISIGWGR